MNYQDTTFWVIPTRLIRDLRQQRLNASQTLMMAFFINMPSSYLHLQDFLMWWGISYRGWYEITRHLRNLGMISVKPVRKRGWVRIHVHPPYRLPQKIAQQWKPLSAQEIPHLPCARPSEMMYFRQPLLRKIQAELRERFGNEPEEGLPID